VGAFVVKRIRESADASESPREGAEYRQFVKTTLRGDKVTRLAPEKRVNTPFGRVVIQLFYQGADADSSAYRRSVAAARYGDPTPISAVFMDTKAGNCGIDRRGRVVVFDY
jgi:hypothetical protein